MSDNALPTLAAALEWIETHWHENRAAPVRVHEAHTTDGALGGLRYSRAFASILGAQPSDTLTTSVRTPCQHPGLTPAQLDAGAVCRMCVIHDGEGRPLVNTGSYEKSIERFRYPMWKALVGLQNALRPRRMPHPYSLILDLAAHGWDARQAARSRDLPWDLAEALYLRAIRQLHGRYQEAPIARRSYVDLSESQRNAETWTAA